MKKNTTKRALVASILMLCLCFSALIGTTFAWFTDSVTSSGNVIQTGKFDVGMYWAEGTADPADKTAWKDASLGAIFNNEYWEPGYSEAKHLKIVNEGTLALKYELAIIPHGEFSKLAEVIEVYYVVGATEMKTRNDLDAHYIGTLNDLVNNGIESGSLLKGESYDATIVLKMKEEAGNEYQNLSIGTEFSIQLVATQLTSEKDGFDNQYDANAFEVVNDIAQLQAAINNAEDTKTIFIKSGDYTLNSMIVVDGKSVTLVGLGSVNIKMALAAHMFTIQDSKNPNSEMNVTIKNINLDGNNVSKNGFNVKYNVTLNLENVNVKNTTWSDVLLDNANSYADGKFYDGTKTVVNLKNSNVEDVSMDTLPVVDTHAYAGAGVTTYAEFNYDKDSTVGVVEKQTISKNYATMFINGCNTDTEHYIFTAANDEQLASVLATIQGNSKYWNTPVVVKLAAGEYDGDYVVNQYPEWTGERGHGTENNPYNGGVIGAPVLNLTVKGEVAQTYGRAATAVPAAIFTGTFTVNGFGNSQTGFSTTKENPAPITFKTVAFQGNYDGSATFVGNSIVFKALNAVDNLYFDGCYFVDATHVTLGSTTPDNMGSVEFANCTFEEGGCLSGRFNNLVVKDCVVNGATKGFINQQKSDATGKIIIDNLTANVGAYLVRTNGGSQIEVSESDITVTESEGTNSIIISRGNGDNVKIDHCENLEADSIISGTGASNSDVKEFYDESGVTYYDDIITGETVLYLVPSDYEKDTVEVAEGVDAIGNYAFSYNTNVKTVILSSTVRDLGRGFDTSSVEKVVLNEGLEVISSRAFRETKSLKEVVISSTVTEIADNAFQKTGLKTIVIPESVKTIGETAFGASLIETVIFEGDIDIQGFAFRGCTNLRKVYMKGNNVNFVPSTLNGRNSTWFCNGESNNNNVSKIDFYVENDIVAARVWKAMGADDDTVTVTVAHPNDATTAYVNTTEDLVKAITDKVANINVYEGTYNLRFTNHTEFNVDGLTINGIGKVYLNIDKTTEAFYSRIQGENVTFNNIDFTGSTSNTVGTTGKATYNNCVVNILELAVSGETYVNSCTIKGYVHTSTDTSTGNAYINNCTVSAAYNASKTPATITFTNCEIEAIETWGVGTTVLNNCTVDLDNIINNNANHTLVVDGKTISYVSTAKELNDALSVNTAIIIIKSEIADTTIKLPATLENVTIKGGTFKNTTVMAADGNSFSYVGLTFDGVTFDNSRIIMTGWRNGDEIIENLTITNCVFKNLDDTTNNAAVHINKAANEPVNGFVFTNNVIDGATGGSKSGIYSCNTGKVIITGNTFNNIVFRPALIQVADCDGVADEIVVSDNVISNTTRLQIYGSEVENADGSYTPVGTDTLSILINENIFKNISGYYICTWGINGDADISRNYYDQDISGRIYWNNERPSDVAGLARIGAYPIYTELNADGTINVDSLVNAAQ